MSARPPRLSRALLAAALPRADRRFALADVEDEFERRWLDDGPATARRWYRQQARRSVFPALRKRLAELRKAATADLREDLGFGVRSLAKTPVVAVVTLVSLSVGIASATAVFTAANSFLLRPPSLQVQEPERIVGVLTVDSTESTMGETAYLDFEEVAQHTTSLQGTAALRMGSVTLQQGAIRERLMVEIVSGNYFDLLGLRPLTGRGFMPEETQVGSAERVTVISHGFWQRRFGGAADVLGQSITLDGNPFTIVGVAPADMVSRMLALQVDAWVPIGIPGGVYRSNEEELYDRTRREYMVVGRLRDQATMAQLNSELGVLADQLHDTWGEQWEDDRGLPLSLVALPDQEARTPAQMRLAVGGVAAIVMFAALLILLVACFNVAGIFLARSSTRSREMAVRLALGASRRRVVRMLLTESLILGVASGALGVLLSTWMIGLFESVPLPIGDINLRFAFDLDYRVLSFTAALSVATSVLFGMAPALESSRPSLVPALRGEDALGGGGQRRRLNLRNLLVIGQAAVAVIFVVGAGSAWSTFTELLAAEWGVNPDRIALMSRPLPDEVRGEAVTSWFEETLAELRAQPGVEQAALASAAEGSAVALHTEAELSIEEYQRGEGESMVVPFNAVTAGYFEMVGIQLARGRSFSADDRQGTAAVAVVTESFARRYWGDEAALGRRFEILERRDLGDRSPVQGPSYEVVGIARDARYQGFEGSGSPYFWVPLMQHPVPRIMTFAKGRDSAAEMVALLRDRIDPTDNTMMIVPPRSYDDLIAFQFSFLNTLARVLAVAGSFGLALAIIGMYGIVSFAVNRRAREIAVRQAVGARPGQLVRAVSRDGMLLGAIGIATGTAAAVALSAAVRSEMEGLRAFDPLSALAGAAILLAVIWVACFVPALRVTRIDPVESLRAD